MDILDQRIDQLRQQIIGLELQAQALTNQIALLDERLDGLCEFVEEEWGQRHPDS